MLLRKKRALESIITLPYERMSVDDILKGILNETISYYDSKAGCIHLYDHKKDVMFLKTSTGLAGALKAKMNIIPYRSPMLKKLIDDGVSSGLETLLISDAGGDYGSAVSVLIKEGSTILAMITLFSRNRNDAIVIMDDIREFSQVLSSVFLRAIKYRRLEKRIDTMKKMSDLSDKILRAAISFSISDGGMIKFGKLLARYRKLLPHFRISVVKTAVDGSEIEVTASTDESMTGLTMSDSSISDFRQKMADRIKSAAVYREGDSIWPEAMKSRVYSSTGKIPGISLVLAHHNFGDVSYFVVVENFASRKFPAPVLKSLSFVFAFLIPSFHYRAQSANMKNLCGNYRKLIDNGMSLLESSRRPSFDNYLSKSVFDLDEGYEGVFTLSRVADEAGCSLTGYCDPEKRARINVFSAVTDIDEVFKGYDILSEEKIPSRLVELLGRPEEMIILPFAGQTKSLVVVRYGRKPRRFNKDDLDRLLLVLKYSIIIYKKANLIHRSGKSSGETVHSGLIEDFSNLLNSIRTGNRRLMDEMGNGGDPDRIDPDGLKTYLQSVDRAVDQGDSILEKLRDGADIVDRDRIEGRDKGMRILIVDDNKELLRTSALMFEALGHVSETSSSASKAIDLLSKDNRFDLVITDVGMPGMDGWEFTRKLRRLGCEIPVIIMTAVDITPDRERLTELKVCDIITKPFNLENISSILDKVQAAT
jgi:CheY-like chemotaxis protein